MINLRELGISKLSKSNQELIGRMKITNQDTSLVGKLLTINNNVLMRTHEQGEN